MPFCHQVFAKLGKNPSIHQQGKVKELGINHIMDYSLVFKEQIRLKGTDMKICP